MERLLQSIVGGAISVGPALLMLAAFALAIGGIAMIRRGANRQKGVLMLVCAVVFIVNVALLTL